MSTDNPSLRLGSVVMLIGALSFIGYAVVFFFRKSMDLAKYQTTNKANRGRPFSDNAKLAPFIECLDSTLRNASHHKSMKIVDDHKTIEYCSGGTGAVRRMAYSRYLGLCNEITLASAALLMIELVLAS